VRTGYVTIDPSDRRVVVSKRIKEKFENGREYYRLNRQAIREQKDLLGQARTQPIWSITHTTYSVSQERKKN